MTRTLRTALTAVLLLGLVAGGAGAAAAEQCDINNNVDNTVIVNDHDVIDIDDILNNISTNVLGIQTDDSSLLIGSHDDSAANGQIY
jgi:septum formation inhibitor-activating ATPase MinD